MYEIINRIVLYKFLFQKIVILSETLTLVYLHLLNI